MRCVEKKKYLDQASAAAAVARSKKDQARRKGEGWRAVIERLESYRCHECTFWHIGKKPAKSPVA